MRYVFLQYHGLELILTITCAGIYIVELHYWHHTFSHDFYFCGLYLMFTILHLITILGIFCGLPISTAYEAIMSFIGSIGFIGAAFWSSCGDNDSDDYRHFMIVQSTFSLTTAFLYLLHSILCLDVYIAIEELHGTSPPLPPPEDEFIEPDKDHHPTELFMAFQPFAECLLNAFPRLCKYATVKEEPQYRIEA